MKASISGKVTARGAVAGRVRSEAGISGKVEIGKTKSLPWYEGEYEVIPKWEDITLKTKQKSMREDVTMQAIPYAEVDNLAGGKTAIIGG